VVRDSQDKTADHVWVGALFVREHFLAKLREIPMNPAIRRDHLTESIPTNQGLAPQEFEGEAFILSDEEVGF